MVFLDAFHYPDEVYNPDEVVPINSPLQKIVKTRFDSASKLPVLFQGEEDVDDFRLDTPWAPGLRVTGRTIVHSPRTSGSVLPSPVDAVLLHELCNGSIPSIGWKAQREMLPPVDFDTVLKRPDHEEPQRLLSSSAPFIRPPMQLNKQMNDTPNASAIDFKEQPSSPKKLASPANLSRVVLQEVESQDPKTPAALSATIETHPEFLQTEIHGELASTMARRRLGIPLSLPGRYGEMTVMSCADTGADENTMTLKEADRLGLKVTSDAEDLKEFCLANGKIIRSLGKAILPCKFSQGYASPDALVTVFYVFQTLVEPIIMGLKFLELTETLNKHRDRLVELEVPPNQPLRVLAMGALRRNLVCRLAKNTVFANADSGSDLDFMSGKYARTHSLALIPNAELIELADGTRVTTSGVVKLPLSVGELDTHDKSQIHEAPSNFQAYSTYSMI
ncbi:hypothetical protein E8E14_005673 [Neopestalotiopsis sp. 37M]|nr:hypothetical protein E8E14_005673 [Neopestalotiopsis sp. 37M]